MLSIGDLAHHTGVSRRQLRHWDDLGLLLPAAVDPETGYRRYTPSQAGRVHAIAALRALDFSLEEISDLLDDQLTSARLSDLLVARERALADEIASASARLAEVRHRLRSIERGHEMTSTTMELGPIRRLSLARLSAAVTDESEIATTARDLVRDLRAATDSDDRTLVLLYDGTTIDGPITVSAGLEVDDDVEAVAGLELVEIPSAERGAAVRYDREPDGVGDAWLALDAELERRELTSYGIYRQLVAPDGTTQLQAPVRPRRACE
jgi:DNA-binding transcriptional MerR regulator